MAEESRLILVGHVMGAFGVRGEVRLHSYTEQPGGIAAYGPLMSEAGSVVLTPRRWRPLKGGVALAAPEIKTREEAEALRGTRLYVPRDRLPAPQADDEFYAIDLIGCAVLSPTGQALGKIVAIHDFGAGDVLEIMEGQRRWFLPFTSENAPQIDLKAKRIIADPPWQLLYPEQTSRDGGGGDDAEADDADG